MNTEQVIQETASLFNVTPREILGRDRSTRVSHAREALVYALRARDWTLKEIGSLLNRNHSTIRFLALQASNHCKDDKSYAERLSKVIHKVRSRNMDAYKKWKEDGDLTPMEALRSMCSELGEVEDEINILTSPHEKRRLELRKQIEEVMDRIDHPVTIKGFGDIQVIASSESYKYDKKLVDRLIVTLVSAGDKFTADMIKECRVRTTYTGGLRITREKGKDK